MEDFEIHVYAGGTSERVDECRALLAQSPESDFVRHRLATLLFLDGQYAEAAELASRVVAEANARPSRLGPASRFEALQELGAAAKRVRPVIEDEARQIPGKDAFRITMEHWDNSIRMYDEEIAQEGEQQS